MWRSRRSANACAPAQGRNSQRRPPRQRRDRGAAILRDGERRDRLIAEIDAVIAQGSQAGFRHSTAPQLSRPAS